MQLELSPDEIKVLKTLLEHELQEINPEIHHTRTQAMREDLKQYRHVLKALFERIVGRPA